MMAFGFFLKKLISFFIEPYGIVLSMFLLGFYYFYKKNIIKAEKFFLLALFFLLLFSYPPFSNVLVKNLEDKYPKYNYKEKISYIHVLGSGHNGDKSQPISSQLGTAGVKRVLEGVIIYKKTPHSKLIFTGYGGRMKTSVAEICSHLAIALGVDKNDIILGEKAKDTKDEALFAKSIVGDKNFVLVTSATHMPRAMKLFKEQGLNPLAAPTNFLKNTRHDYLILPTIDSFYKSQIAMHEYYGILFAKIKGLIFYFR